MVVLEGPPASGADRPSEQGHLPPKCVVHEAVGTHDVEITGAPSTGVCPDGDKVVVVVKINEMLLLLSKLW